MCSGQFRLVEARYGRLGELMFGVFGCVSVSPGEARQGRRGEERYIEVSYV